MKPLSVLEGSGAAGAVRLVVVCPTGREGWLPLEEAAPVAPPGAPSLAVVPDDQSAMQQLLVEACGHAGGEVRNVAPTLGRAWRVFPSVPARVERRLETLLGELPIRPWSLPANVQQAPVAIVPLSSPALRLHPIHRAVSGLRTFEAERFLTLVREYASIVPLEAPLRTPEGLADARERLALLAHGHHAVLLVLPNGDGRILRFRQGLELDHVRAAPKNPTLRSLDLALLNTLVLRTVLGVEHPERAAHPHVQRVESLEALVECVVRGDAQVGFGLNAPPVWEIRAVIEAAQQLPPDTLRLEPALPPGLL